MESEMTMSATERLHRNTALSFGKNVLRAMHVSAEDENGEPKKLTQHELAEKSGVGRSTIAKYSAVTGDDATAVNPDLATICQLAAALNVSPAFLLMTPTDWNHLAQAAMYFSQAMKDEKFIVMAQEMAEAGSANARTSAACGLALATKFKLYSDEAPHPEMSPNFAQQISARKARTRSGILAMSALPPLAELKRGQIAPLLSLCAIMGAHLHNHEE